VNKITTRKTKIIIDGTRMICLKEENEILLDGNILVMIIMLDNTRRR